MITSLHTYLGLSNTEKKREIGPKSPDVAECTYTICLHNATAAVARLEDDLHSTMVRVV